MIYLDNAATSWPKPPEVLRAMTEVLERAGGNPGRSGHLLSIEAARVLYQAREAVADFFHAPDPLRVIFTSNATHALNLVIKGLLKPGDCVVTTSVEHNAVMRPLRQMERQGLNLRVVPCTPDGSLDVKRLAEAVDPGTRLVVLNHASNVLGTILPVAETARIAHRSGALLLVDASQTAGVVPVDMQATGMDLLAFTGHKGLQGPPGIGGLVINEGVDVRQIDPLILGGTGSQSELEQQPDDLPDKFESGTPNIVGAAGLLAGIHWLTERGLETVRSREKHLTQALIEWLSSIRGVQLHGPCDPERSIAILSITVPGRRVSEICLRLDEEYGVLTRAGLHCAPAAHRTAGTFPEGTIRLACGVFTTLDDVKATIGALERIVGS